MSGTRSPSPKAPATERPREALLIVAHGDRGGAGGNRLASTLAEALRRGSRFAAVGVGYLRADPPFEQVAADMVAAQVGQRLRVLPLLMSDGYYARQEIPQRLGLGEAGAPEIAIEPPLGLHPGLAELVAGQAAATLQQSGFDAARATLLLVAHGSTKSETSAAASRHLATAIQARRQFARVDVAFLEEPPFLAEQLQSLAPPLCAFGLFVGDGMHAGDDLPRAVERCRRADIMLAPPLADCPAIVEMIAAGLADDALFRASA